MSIMIHLFYTGKEDAARKFAQEMEATGIADRIRQEEGCLSYEYFLPMQDSQTVLLIDSWTCQEAIDKHHASILMQEVAKLREKYDLHTKAQRFIREDMPEKDESYLRK